MKQKSYFLSNWNNAETCRNFEKNQIFCEKIAKISSIFNMEVATNCKFLEKIAEIS